MGSARCPFSAVGALRRVFLPQPAVRSAPPSFLLGRALPGLVYAQPQANAARNASSSMRKQIRRRKRVKGDKDDYDGDGEAGGGPRTVKYKLNRLPRDEEITHPLLELVREDGTRGPPTPTAQLLRRIDPQTESLVVVALPNPEAPDSPRHPIAKIINKAAVEKVQRERRKVERQKAVHVKELELHWAIDPHDLEHRLRKMREWLEKGMRVEVLLLNKKHRRVGTAAEIKDTLRKVRDVADEVPGAKEVGTAAGDLGDSMKLRFDGPVGGIPAR